MSSVQNLQDRKKSKMTAQNQGLFVRLFDCINIPFLWDYSYFLQVKRTILKYIVLFMRCRLFWPWKMSLLTEITIKKIGLPQRFCETKDLWEKEEQAEKSLLFCKTKEQDQKALLRRVFPSQNSCPTFGLKHPYIFPK